MYLDFDHPLIISAYDYFSVKEGIKYVDPIFLEARESVNKLKMLEEERERNLYNNTPPLNRLKSKESVNRNPCETVYR